MQKLPTILLGLGIVVVLISVTSLLLEPTLLGRTLKVDPDVGPERWSSPSKSTNNFLKIYFFNVSNPAMVIAGEKPRLQEVGPYVYQAIVRTNMESPKTKETILYKEYERYYFQQDLSNGRETDILTLINLPFVGFAQEVSKMSFIPRMLVMGVVSRFNEGMFTTKTAKQYLFGGYKQELLATFSSITGEEYMANNTFGYFYERNNSNIFGSFLVSTGINNRENLGKIEKWNGKSEIKWWKDENCRKISDTFEGTIFPPGKINKSTILTIFDSQLCRTFDYGFKKQVDHSGISAYRFIFLPSNLEDPRTRPENMCYCTHPGRNDEDCPKDGSYQLNVCAKNASISISLPHFLYGSKEYLESADSYHPDESLHASYIDIDPLTGVVLKKVSYSQTNLHVRPLKSFNDFRKIRNMLFPSIWVQESREITPEALRELKSTPPMEFLIPVFALIGFGVLLIFASILIFVVRLRKSRVNY